MGGDEFAVYAFEDTAQILQDKIDSFKKMIDEKGYHVAVGYSYAEEGDPDYRTRKTEADNRMYDAKREFYRNGNDRRRRGTD
jgi:GGDEF domain-containing protein